MTPTQDTLRFGVALVIFWLVVWLMGRLFPLKNYGIEVEPGYITIKSSRFKTILYEISEKKRSIWRAMSNLSIVFGVGLMIFAVFFLADNLVRLAQPGARGTPLLPFLPGLTVRLFWFPYLLLPISLGIITHEATHGIIARLENISLKSAGLALMLAFFGGFVEADEDEFKAASTTSKLRVLSAGSFVNFVAFLIATLFVSALFVNVPSGIVITEVSGGSLIEEDGRLRQWDVIYDINGTLRNMALDLNQALRKMHNFLANVSRGDTLMLNTSKGLLQIRVRNSLSEKPLGISSYTIYYPSRLGSDPVFDVQLYLTLEMGVTVYGSLAVFNMLPLFPFDGDKFLFYVIEGFRRRRSREVRIAFNALFFAIMASNMIVSFIKYGPI